MGNVIRMLMLNRGIILLVVVGLLACAPSYAEAGDEWQFHVAPYAWLAGLNGDVSTLQGLPDASVDLDFWDDILEDLNGSIMIVGEARKGRWGLFGDFEYVNVLSEDSTPCRTPVFPPSRSRPNPSCCLLRVSTRLFETGGAFLDIMAGFRMWSVDTDLTLTAGLLSERTFSNSETWLDPMFGIKWLVPMGDTRFFVSSHLLGGGFGAGSDYFWDMNLNIGYRWTETVATTLGYRYLDVDYDDDDFLYDVSQHGPIIGLSWRF